FHLEGGPGFAATAALPFYLGPGRGYRRARDLVLLDQRGTGDSNPLHCPAIESRSPLEDPYIAADVDACRAALSRSADLRMFGTAIAADDVDRVRAALGYPQIDLWALSYGTQLAQVYLRAFPGRVRRAVFMGAAPLDLRTPLWHARNAQRVLDLLYQQCRAEPACAAAYPTMPELPRGARAEALRRLLGTTTDQRRLFQLLDRAARGDGGPLTEAMRGSPSGAAEGLYLSNACAEGTLHIEPGQIEGATAHTFLGDQRVRSQLAACRRWPVTPVDRSFFAPVRAHAPVLIISGDMDATTPPVYADDVCAMLGTCRVIRVPALAHGPFDLDHWQNGGCVDALAVAFLEAADPRTLDISCVATMRPPPFALPGR
ncbi:MAG TPA: alpha/beta fold hydrolase, partial [Kofleriaceae bacterium]|nr:alpha/beta fold hydrolase [Kofleriaceae bacterium]